jgi:hypothetical protein
LNAGSNFLEVLAIITDSLVQAEQTSASEYESFACYDLCEQQHLHPVLKTATGQLCACPWKRAERAFRGAVSLMGPERPRKNKVQTFIVSVFIRP